MCALQTTDIGLMHGMVCPFTA